MSWTQCEASSGQQHDDLRVLVYHRVFDEHAPGRGDPHLWSATRAGFAAQMALLARYFAPVTAWQVVDTLCGRARLPRRAVLVTFDDGYRDFLGAWPIMKRYGVPALVFVPTAFPGSSRRFWWDELYEMVMQTPAPLVHFGQLVMRLGSSQQRWRAVRRLNRLLKGLRDDERSACIRALREQLGRYNVPDAAVLSWQEIRALTAEGLAVGAHTVSHPTMPALSVEELHAELVQAHADLRRELGSTLPLFAYPYGLADKRALGVLRHLGYVGAFVSLLGRNQLCRQSPFLLHRQSVDRHHSALVVAAGLFGPYVRAREIWRAVRSTVRPAVHRRVVQTEMESG